MSERISLGGAPVFVVGSDRSGSTMLRLMLNKHPSLRMPEESFFVSSLVEELPLTGVLSAVQQRRAAEIVAEEPRLLKWRTDRQALAGAVSALSNPTLADVVAAVFHVETDATDGVRWGDKTPPYVFWIDEIATVFPTAQFVHLIRDGRDVVESLARWRFARDTLGERVDYWVQCVEAGERAGALLGPARFIRVSYESLVLDPAVELARICRFLGVPFAPEMVDFHYDAHDLVVESERDIHAKVSRAPQAEDVQRWRREASGVRVFLFEAMAGKTLDDLGLERRFDGRSVRLMPIVAAAYRLLSSPLLAAKAAYRRFPLNWRLRVADNAVGRRLRRWILRV